MSKSVNSFIKCLSELCLLNTSAQILKIFWFCKGRTISTFKQLVMTHSVHIQFALIWYTSGLIILIPFLSPSADLRNSLNKKFLNKN